MIKLKTFGAMHRTEDNICIVSWPFTSSRYFFEWKTLSFKAAPEVIKPSSSQWLKESDGFCVQIDLVPDVRNRKVKLGVVTTFKD